MTTTRHRTTVGRALAVATTLTLTVLALGACGSQPYAAGSGPAATSPSGGGATGSPGSSGGSTGGVAAGGAGVATVPSPPDMPTDPAMTPGTQGTVTGPDSPVSPTDQPSPGRLAPAISGRVTDASGKPVAGLMVGVVSYGDPMVAIPEIGVLTGPDGRYAWPALPPGAFEVQVSRDGTSASARVSVTAGHTATADLTLR